MVLPEITKNPVVCCYITWKFR